MPIEKKIIPDDANLHEGINLLCDSAHGRAHNNGWWHNLETDEPKDRNDGEMIALMHSELSEALEGHRTNAMDKHLPHRKSVEVEMADCVIRIADYCRARGLDLAGAIVEKMQFNDNRADHKIENRLKEDGKKY